MIVKLLKFINKTAVWLLILPVKFYRYSISPLLPNSCRHVPTCSEYAIEALKVHGAIKGSGLAIWRILRCNPWGTHGYDPVPPKNLKKQTAKYKGRGS
jgi:uncharacterized protein